MASVLLTATAALLSTAYNEQRSATQSYLRNTAFYLAEAGLEKAAATIATTEIDSQVVLQETDLALSNGAVGSFQVVIERSGGSSLYAAHAIGEVVHGSASSSVQAIYSEFDFGGLASSTPGFALAAVSSIKLNHSGGNQIKIASYDSTANYGVPDWISNAGYDAAIGVSSAGNNKIQLNNAYIQGTVRTGGGTVSSAPFDAYNATNNAYVLGPDTPAGTLFDSSRVTTDFDETLAKPTVPELDGDWAQVVVHQNDNRYRNQRTLHLGAPGQKTYYNIPYALDTQSGGGLQVSGDVIVELGQNMNLRGTINLLSGATLKIYLKQNAAISADCGDWSPADLEVNLTGGADVVLQNFSTFTGKINAPNSTVRVQGRGGSPSSQLRGSVIGNKIEVTNGVNIFYDVQGGGSGTSAADLETNGWQQILPRVAQAKLASATENLAEIIEDTPGGKDLSSSKSKKTGKKAKKSQKHAKSKKKSEKSKKYAKSEPSKKSKKSEKYTKSGPSKKSQKSGHSKQGKGSGKSSKSKYSGNSKKSKKFGF